MLNYYTLKSRSLYWGLQIIQNILSDVTRGRKATGIIYHVDSAVTQLALIKQGNKQHTFYLEEMVLLAQFYRLAWLISSYSQYAEFLLTYNTLNKITGFWMNERSTINPNLYSQGYQLLFFPKLTRSFLKLKRSVPNTSEVDHNTGRFLK